MSARILIVEDEPGLVMTLTDMLVAEGHEVDAAPDGPAGLRKALKERYDLIILDVMLPGMSGFDVCRTLRSQGRDTPVLMLTARGRVADRVVGLKIGADDYLAKPFAPEELSARIEALLRRARKEPYGPLERFEFGDVTVDFEHGVALKAGQPVPLAGKELQLLRYLVERRGQTVSREELLRSVWEYSSGVTSRTVDVHIAWLRQKLEDSPQSPRWIQTVRGVGYRFVP
ncbi:MAG: response regulator transcription factor [Bryobacteraceae bacterium]|nr:response regulator transcription factor [Bryobacteraceae bacterium]